MHLLKDFAILVMLAVKIVLVHLTQCATCVILDIIYLAQHAMNNVLRDNIQTQQHILVTIVNSTVINVQVS